MRIMVVLLALAIFSSCTRLSDTEKKLHGLLEKYNNPVNLHEGTVIVIPLYGCGACVDKAVDFMRQNYSSGKYIFVLSVIFQKEYSIKIGEKIISRSIVYDTLNYAGMNGLILGAPVAYYKRDTLCSRTLQLKEDYDQLQRILQGY
ncbi:MAG: hypothetical protein EHM93_15870 [Bacteroidales bacterium]|nr:MAG: hypothetical protein EHM93_15870 [Bacteroidales bacterium]